MARRLRERIANDARVSQNDLDRDIASLVENQILVLEVLLDIRDDFDSTRKKLYWMERSLIMLIPAAARTDFQKEMVKDMT